MPMSDAPIVPTIKSSPRKTTANPTMSTETTTAAHVPDYIASAKPNPRSNRAPWFKNTAPTYAGIFLWFAFWDPMAGNGLAAGGLGATLLGVVIGALSCLFLLYIVPRNLGMKTGLPLYVVRASIFGAAGSLIMPGFFMG